MFGYAFDQYIWQPDGDAKRGVGIFFNFGVSDGDPNPVEYNYMVGLGGNGVVRGRPHDTFGIGWARTQLSGSVSPFLRQELEMGLDHEDVIEMYYNAAITPWLNISPSIQIVDSALELESNDQNQLEKLGTAAVFFLRTYIRF